MLRCSRFLTQVWDYSQAMIARQAAAPAATERSAGTSAAVDGEVPVRDTTEHLRLKLSQWCEAGVGRITNDMESLEMHSAVRNVMRLFDRIKDFEKRVVAREPELGGANLDALVEALTLLAQLLAPLAPHLAEELWIALATTRVAHRRRGQAYRCRCTYEHTHGTEPDPGQAADAFVRDRTGLPPLRPQLPARGRDLRVS